MLMNVSSGRESMDGANYCSHIIPDERSILFSTDHAILRLDRATRALTTLVSGLRYGARALAEDESRVFYIGEENEVRSIPRDGGVPVVLRASSHDPQEASRLLLTLDGDRVYFHEGYSLLRAQKDGTGLVVLAEGNADDWVAPMTLGIAEHHVYFERMTRTYENKYQGALYRAAR
jgi:hypothetical protein